MQTQIIQITIPTPEESEEPPALVPCGQENKVRLELHTQTLSTAFRERYFPAVVDMQWNDWRWQVRNRFRTMDSIQRVLPLTEKEKEAFLKGGKKFPVAVTPYYMSLIDPLQADNPLRRTVIPQSDELQTFPEESCDPLAEEPSSPVKGLIHRYPNRVLFLATDFCTTCCRYCTRSRLIGDIPRENGQNNWEPAFKYIEDHPEISDVVISGGDPLTLPIETLERLLMRLRSIPHVEIIRIGTKVPVVLPMRIISRLTNMIAKYHPVFMSIHVTHPDELTPEMSMACAKLANAGIVLGSQTVLLKGINDSVPVMRKLMQGLLKLRVKPYYIYQCDPISGSRHFRTEVAKGIEIIKGLRGHISGYAVPHYVVDAPGGGGKIPMLPNYVKRVADGKIIFKNYANKEYSYPDETYIP